MHVDFHPFTVVAGETFTSLRIVVAPDYYSGWSAFTHFPALIKDERDIKVVQHEVEGFRVAIFDYFPGLPRSIVASFTGQHCASVAEASRERNKSMTLFERQPVYAPLWEEGVAVLTRTYPGDKKYEVEITKRLEEYKMRRLKVDDDYLSISSGLDLGAYDPKSHDDLANLLVFN